MNCPACETVMAEEDFAGGHGDVCRNMCRGSWMRHLRGRTPLICHLGESGCTV